MYNSDSDEGFIFMGGMFAWIVDGFVVSVWAMTAECWMGTFYMDKYIRIHILQYSL